MNTRSYANFQTEAEFTLPKGYLAGAGVLHRRGVMRLATAADAREGEEAPVITEQQMAQVGNLAIASDEGRGVHGQVVRARPGELGRAVVDAAEDVRASLVVVGAAIESRRGFRHPFSRDVWSVLHDAPCPVMISATSPDATHAAK